MTEEDLEREAELTPGRRAVAINEKHACITVVVKDPSSQQASGVGVISEASPSNRVSIDEPSGSSVIGGSGIGGGRNLDKINNLVQKEIALGRVGVTREKAYRVIAQALDAMKWVDVTDEQGNVGREWQADLDKQRWGAEMAIKMFGDMIERKEIEHDIGDKTLDRFRAMSVADLKARAADLLLGRKSAVDMGGIADAEVVG